MERRELNVTQSNSIWNIKPKKKTSKTSSILYYERCDPF